ncbi:MAG: hypothetical protein AAGA58_15240 [Verrucomicrobiota bacterium]
MKFFSKSFPVLSAATCVFFVCGCNKEKPSDDVAPSPRSQIQNFIEVPDNNNFSNFLGAAALLSRRADVHFEHAALPRTIRFSSQPVIHDLPAVSWNDGQLYWDQRRVSLEELSNHVEQLRELCLAADSECTVAIVGKWDVSMEWGLQILTILAEEGISRIQPPFDPVNRLPGS